MAPHSRKNRKTRKNRKSNKKVRGGGLNRTYFGKVTDSNGKVYKDIDFSEEAWQTINSLLSEHVKSNVLYDDLVYTGFGGDKASGVVTVIPPSSLPPMDFTIDETNYKMSFDRVENEN